MDRSDNPTLRDGMGGLDFPDGSRAPLTGRARNAFDEVRRGHWRQLEGGKRIWIKWMLVGDAASGFVNKIYRD